MDGKKCGNYEMFLLTSEEESLVAVRPLTCYFEGSRVADDDGRE